LTASDVDLVAQLGTYWSTRTMAAEMGISEATVRRIWHAQGL
jgi:hypothetical protein